MMHDLLISVLDGVSTLLWQTSRALNHLEDGVMTLRNQIAQEANRREWERLRNDSHSALAGKQSWFKMLR